MVWLKYPGNKNTSMGFGEVAVGVIFSGILFCLIIFPFAFQIQPHPLTFIVGAVVGLIVISVYSGRVNE